MKYAGIILLILLSSCYTERKAAQQMDRAHSEYELVAAQKCSSWFPIRIDTVPGEVIIRTHTDTIPGETIFVDCDSIVAANKSDGAKVRHENKVPVQCPPSIIKHDTFQQKVYITKENTAALQAQKILTDKVIAKAKNYTTWAGIATGIAIMLAIMLFVVVRQIKKSNDE